MKKNSKTPKLPAAKATAAVATVEPSNQTIKQSKQSNNSPIDIAGALTTQYQAVVAATGQMLREAVKFGAMLMELETIVGKSHGGPNGGGDGIKGWLAEHCPEINYSTALKYKLLAEKNAQMLGGGAMALAALQGETTVTQPDGEVIDVEAKVIEKRDEIFAEANSFSKLEQMWFDLFGPGDKPKAKKASGPLPTLTRKEAAKATWNIFMQKATAHSLKDAIPLLGEKETQVCYDDLRDLVNMLKDHLNEF